MDSLDRSLLHLLTKDARAPISDLAKRLRVSRGTIQNRISKLINNKIIHRFTVQVGAAQKDHQVSAFTLVRIDATNTQPPLATIRRMPAVIDVHSLSGRFDYVVEIRTNSLAQLDTILDQIRDISEVIETQSHLRLSSVT